MFGKIIMKFNNMKSAKRWLKWQPTSTEQLELSESLVFEHIDSFFEIKMVTLPQSQHSLRTVMANQQEKTNTPLVMVHGMGHGVGIWAQNIDSLAKKRRVYAFDMLGFGRSSRRKFKSSAQPVERELVESIEEWRKEMKIDKMILMGHSLGGYVVSSYALKYPDKIQHLFLIDPWGFNELPEWIRWLFKLFTLLEVLTIAFAVQGSVLMLTTEFFGHHGPFLFIGIYVYVMSGFVLVILSISRILIGLSIRAFDSRIYPLAFVRVAGPLGPRLNKIFRRNLQAKFSSKFGDDTIVDYIYHCNAQRPPSGEGALLALSTLLRWAQRPMIFRIGDIDMELPITFVYGSDTWIDKSCGDKAKDIRDGSMVNVRIIEGAGHHVYADKPDVFNELMDTYLDSIDKFVDDAKVKKGAQYVFNYGDIDDDFELIKEVCKLKDIPNVGEVSPIVTKRVPIDR